MALGLLHIVVTFLAIARTNRLINRDTLPPVVRLRSWVIRRWGPDSSIAELIQCPWCISAWTPPVWITLSYLAWNAHDAEASWIAALYHAYMLLASTLSSSYLYGLIAQTLDNHHVGDH